jgi:glutamate--cysteine ligase
VVTVTTVSVTPSTDPAPDLLRDRDRAEAYVASVCFKHGPPRYVGAEIEWTVHHAQDRCQPIDSNVLAKALGPHAPATLRPDSPNLPLRGGSPVTVEPGGQVELSTPPKTTAADLLTTLTADTAQLQELLAAEGLELGTAGVDPHRPPRRILDTPRYAAMNARYDRLGPDGAAMMCSTAGLQVCLDTGEAAQVASRWNALHALGPALLAAFANSPDQAGASTGWASVRTRVVLGAEPARSSPGETGDDPAAGWARRVLDTPLICWRHGGASWDVPGDVTFADWIAGALPGVPTTEDLDYHLSTMFTPVRPRGYFEVRYLDSQPPGEWSPAVALLIALFSADDVVDAALDAAARGARRGRGAPHPGVPARCAPPPAAAALELGLRHMHRLGLPTELSAPVIDSLDRRLAAATAKLGGKTL